MWFFNILLILLMITSICMMTSSVLDMRSLKRRGKVWPNWYRTCHNNAKVSGTVFFISLTLYGWFFL